MASTLDLWNKASAFPAGKWTFTRMLCLKAPYFSSIAPLFEELKPNYCKISIKKNVRYSIILVLCMRLRCATWLN